MCKCMWKYIRVCYFIKPLAYHAHHTESYNCVFAVLRLCLFLTPGFVRQRCWPHLGRGTKFEKEWDGSRSRSSEPFAIPCMIIFQSFVRNLIYAFETSSLKDTVEYLYWAPGCTWNVKFSQPTPWRHIGGGELQLHSFIIEALDGCVWWTSCPGHFIPGKNRATEWIGGWVGCRVGPDVSEKKNLLPPHPPPRMESNPDRPARKAREVLWKVKGKTLT
jgi:hypothetical protein